MSRAVVNVRCPVSGCRRSLLSVTAWPAEGDPLWAGARYGVWTEDCSEHKEIRRRETIWDADARRAAKGLPPLDLDNLMVFVSWSTLRPFYLDSIQRGRAVDFAP